MTINNIQQNNTSRVASFNPNPRWPTGYFEVLEELGIDKELCSFYAHWVRRFFNVYLKNGKRRRDLGSGEIKEFLAALKQDPASQTWQVEQAADALVIYYEQFRGVALNPPPKHRHPKQQLNQRDEMPYGEAKDRVPGISPDQLSEPPTSIPKPRGAKKELRVN